LAATSEIEILKRICRDLAQEHKIKPSEFEKLSTVFGQRFTKAWEALESKRVKKYVFNPSSRVVWIVVGKGRDYLIMPAVDFCTCNDFYFRVMNRQIHLCYHLIGQKLAEALKKYDSYEEDDELYEALMKEWKKPIA
jgi:predicted nucleic acid-binding Zn finger protein